MNWLRARSTPRSRIMRIGIALAIVALMLPGGLAVRRYRANVELERRLQTSRYGGNVVTTHDRGHVTQALDLLSDTQYGPLPEIGEWLQSVWWLMGEPVGINSAGSGCNLGEIFARCADLSSLERIDLDSCGTIGDELHYVAGRRSLKRLWLRKMHITPAAVEAIATLNRLEDLNVQSSSGVDDDAMRVIGKLPRLRELTLSGPGVTDDGVAALETLKNLSELSLWQTDITDASVPVLIRMAPQRLSVSETGITAQGVADLRRALPTTIVKADDEEGR